uniref:Target of EGR1, exonuclease n=1 Tax=Scophthalmus maximus TaxID=52904 RepID=A0A8D3AXA8_SCOMX
MQRELAPSSPWELPATRNWTIRYNKTMPPQTVIRPIKLFSRIARWLGDVPQPCQGQELAAADSLCVIMSVKFSTVTFSLIFPLLQAADTYLVQVYNLTLLCSEEYMIEPQSVQFLVQHGFDFNKQYAHGIPYCGGNNKGGSDYQGVHIRALFTELLRARKPLVFHNGLIDMVFLYQSFYAHLPERLATFTADLSDMFPAGIFDTKYVTEFELRLTASYLEYAYKKCQLDNSRSLTSGGTGHHVHVEFCQYAGHMSSYVDYRVCPVIESPEGQTDICQRFSAFGWCPNGTKCPLSHDTDQIILLDEKNKDDKKKRRKRRREKKGGKAEAEGSLVFDGAPKNKISFLEVDQDETAYDQPKVTADPCPESGPLMDIDGNTGQNEGEIMKIESKGNGVCEDNTDTRTSARIVMSDEVTNMTTDMDESRTVDGGREFSDHAAVTDAQKKKAEAGTHRAGFDAFMTGYIFAHSCTLVKTDAVGAAGVKEEEQSWLPTCLNKVYLSGKAAPLNVVKSTFSKSSKAHVQKMATVWGQ